MAIEDFVEFPIPSFVAAPNTALLRQLFQDKWCDHAQKWSEVFDLDCEPKNRHAIVDRVTVMDVVPEKDDITVTYQVEFSQFEACKDVTNTWLFHRQLVGTRIGGVWRFRKHQPLPQRSTFEEF